MTTKVFIVDDHPFTRAGVRSILETNSTIDIIGEAEDGLDAVKQVIEKQPDLVVMDINMPQLSGIDATKRILHKLPDIKIIALSIHKGEIYVKKMLDAGASGYLLKDEAPEELLKAIDKVNKGDIYLSSGVTRAALNMAKDSEALTKTSVLQSKLQRPSISFDYVVRTKIIHELESNIIRPLSIVSAGAGYGKSIVVSQWLEQTDFLYSWISLDAEHNDFRKFLYYLIAAVEKVFPGLLKKTQELVQASILPPEKELSNTVLNELCDIDQNFILVLDDYHLIKEMKIHNLLDEWLRFPPPSVHLCIVARRDPPLNIKSLGVNGRMTEIRMDDLSFNDEEIVEFFEQVRQVKLDDKLVKTLQDKTEGWIIGLRLVSMATKSPEDIDKTLQFVGGGIHSLADYLLAEVLANQPEPLQDQLFTTAVLDRFCANVIDAIIEQKGENGSEEFGAALIEWLIKSNHFIISLDNDGKWFRYHHMFQDFLLLELKKRKTPQQIEEINLRASYWFEQHNLLEEAMHHAIASKEYSRAVEIIKAHRINLLNTSQWVVLKRIFKQLPESVVEVDPELLLVDAHLSFFMADHLSVGVVVEKMMPLMSDVDKKADFYGEYHFFLGYITMYLKKDLVASLNNIKIALEEIPESSAAPRSLAEWFYPMFLQLAGQYSNAIDWLEDTIKKSEKFAPIRRNRLYLGVFLSSTNEADLNMAEKYASRGLSLARESKMDDTLSNCLMAIGEMYIRRGEWQSAIPYFEEVMGLKFNVHTRCAIDCIIGLVIIHDMIDNKTKSLGLIGELESFTQELDDHHERFVWSCKVRHHLIRKNRQIVNDLLGQYRQDFVHLVFWLDIPEITYCRALIFAGSEENLSTASQELNGLELLTTSQNNKVHQLEVYALQAILYDKLGDLEKAKEKLTTSIELAEPGSITAYYVELGEPIAQLISKMPDEFKNKPIIIKILELSKITSANLLQGSLDKVTESSTAKDQLNALTKSELKVLQCIAEGLRNQEIADKLFNSEETIKKHIYHMFQKLHVKNRLSLVTKAKELGILV